jgi:hypothetical protein
VKKKIGSICFWPTNFHFFSVFLPNLASDSVQVRECVGGSGRVRADPGGSGRVREGLGVYGRVYQGTIRYESMWDGTGGWMCELREGAEGYGRDPGVQEGKGWCRRVKGGAEG